jgi:hypothetical protein
VDATYDYKDESGSLLYSVKGAGRHERRAVTQLFNELQTRGDRAKLMQLFEH